MTEGTTLSTKYIFCNGVANPRVEDLQPVIDAIKKATEEVDLIHNTTMPWEFFGFKFDANVLKFDPSRTEEEQERLIEDLYIKISTYLEDNEKLTLCLIMHSHGAYLGRQALKKLNPIQRKRIVALAYGGAALIERELAAFSQNCIHSEDFIAKAGSQWSAYKPTIATSNPGEKDGESWHLFLEYQKKTRNGFDKKNAIEQIAQEQRRINFDLRNLSVVKEEITDRINKYNAVVLWDSSDISKLSMFEKMSRTFDVHTFLAPAYYNQLQTDLKGVQAATSLIQLADLELFKQSSPLVKGLLASMVFALHIWQPRSDETNNK